MRTKEKARRRVTSPNSLDCMDTPTHSAVVHPKDVVALGKRPVSHVQEPKESLSPVAKRLCSSEHVRGTNPKAGIQIGLASQA